MTDDAKWTYDLTTTVLSAEKPGDQYTLLEVEPQFGPWGPWSGWIEGYHLALYEDTKEYDYMTIPAQFQTEYNYSRFVSNDMRLSAPVYGVYNGINCGNYQERGWGSQLSVTGQQYNETLGSYYLLFGYESPYWYNEQTRETQVARARNFYLYRTREKYYTYQKIEQVESDVEVTESDTISNIVKWVKYIEK